jgi:transposase-like protein
MKKMRLEKDKQTKIIEITKGKSRAKTQTQVCLIPISIKVLSLI